MIHDAALPSGIRPVVVPMQQAGIWYLAASWTPGEIACIVQRLTGPGRERISSIPMAELLDAWEDTVAAFRRRGSPERVALDPALARLSQLSEAGLEAALEAVLGGVTGPPARVLASEAEAWKGDLPDRPLVAVILASNLPALAVQPLLPALLLRCPVLLKSPSSEPLFAPAFVSALTRRLPALEPAMAAVTWKGGDVALEAPVLTSAGRVLAYGTENALADLECRIGDRMFGYGPRVSLAIIAASAATEEVSAGLARDIALFDQRGCLSIHALFTDGDPWRLARGIAEELEHLADDWPPGWIDPAAAAAVQQIRADAALRGLSGPELPLTAGTVVIDPEPRFRPSPGLRTVRIHPVPDLARVPGILSDWTDRLQGASLAGAEAEDLQPRLTDLGISHFAPPGRLQAPDASWHNGGVHPFTALTGSPPVRNSD